MKKLTIVIVAFTFFTLFLSCSRTHNDRNNAKTQETPKALQDDKIEISSYKRMSNDLIEELYQELVDKTPALKKIEEDLAVLRPKQYDLNDKFNNYNNKSDRFYTYATNSASNLTDSLLKKKIINLLYKSKNLYENKTAELNSLIKFISHNHTTIEEHHIVLKIVLTLPLIEKYQNDNLPDKKEHKEIIKQQKKLIEQIDNSTPQF